MRMWNINPKYMCRQHILGEHLELHMLATAVKTKQNINGYIKNKLVETHNIQERHNTLVREMLRRGYQHKTPLRLQTSLNQGKINIKANMKELAKRCRECRKRLAI